MIPSPPRPLPQPPARAEARDPRRRPRGPFPLRAAFRAALGAALRAAGRAALGLPLALAATAAAAFWDVSRSEKDVFGNVNVTATSFGDNGNIIRFECGSSHDPFVAFLIRSSEGDIPELPALFLMRDAGGTRHQAAATLTPWNDRFVAVRVTDPAMLRRLAELMVVATRAIPLGIEVPLIDLRISDTFSPRGSTAAGRAVLAHCLD